ncbi:endolytic transglycosylase MltG [Roseospira navarrensis]|uniref:Endolytic murein transglycosylase n=1 Tax=Roseospira navarrensis TaxID=140058 RepID=A0A7X1ZAW9_9PROT|nr:endolytic transglycosylase MltG [Roseospira navarrensis]MQX35173.1 endolytic transglycosylase MltG [Roseospira navarrensis]
MSEDRQSPGDAEAPPGADRPAQPGVDQGAGAGGRGSGPPRARRRRGGGVVRALVTLVSLLAGIAVVGAYAGWRYLQDAFTTPGPLTEPVTVVVPQGATLGSIAGQLADAGVIRDATIFEWGARLAERARDLKAGEYRFDVAVTPSGALDILTRGDVVARKVTVSEGLTTHQILDVVRSAEGLEGAVTLDPPEGSLLPETYHFTLGDTRDAILRRMMAAMDETVAELWPERQEGLPIETPEDAVILASIVEKETGLASERAHVAGVFINRLRKGMRLQSDPTVIYGITTTGSLGRPLLRSDLREETPYNTYVIGGLPPGPISNPGRDTIAAVLNPKDTDDLFFVADGTGGHAFARTLAEHNRNVAKWRRFLREQRAGSAD